jgi:hypothetical protein
VEQEPDDPDTLSPREQIALGNEVARKQGLEADTYVDPQVDRIARRLLASLPARYAGPPWPWRII